MKTKLRTTKTKTKKESSEKTYSKSLDFFETEIAIKLVKDTFEKKLSKKLRLLRVTAPRFLVVGTGLQDDLAGTQVPVSFKIKKEQRPVEIVHSLAKWKRYTLGKYSFKEGTGLYTDMDAIRKDEDLSDIHSIYVDQWDWEKVITKKQRTIPFLKETVKKIYAALRETGKIVEKKYPELKVSLPEQIKFIHAEELEKIYPTLTAKEREDKITKLHGAVFLIGIGHKLESGKPHDVRAADYDDWSTETSPGLRGLNGDILVWDDILDRALELSSMGIRVDERALTLQLELSKLTDRKELEFHKAIFEKQLPLTIGGGIGQSRLCLFLLHKRHIGEVQSSVWPKEIEQDAKEKGITLL
ncbi:MAG: aspartate--ammonia ligase [Candidatus Nanoarchaeia archaeon]